MATLQAATSSTEAGVTDPEAVSELCDRYWFGGVQWEISDAGKVAFWGYDTFTVYRCHEYGDPDHEYGIVTREFLWELAEYVAEGEELDIQIAGFTKCRFPMHAQRWVVRPEEVRQADLSGHKPIGLPGTEAPPR